MLQIVPVILQICIVAGLLGLCRNEVLGQQVILNTRGERIVVYPDGSWRYYERADSSLLSKNLVKEDVLMPEEKARSIYEKPTSGPATDRDISGQAIKFAERIDAETHQARKALASAVEDKFEVEGRLSQAQDNKKLIEPDILSALEDEYELKTLGVKTTKKHLQQMQKLHAESQKLLALPVNKKPKALDKLIVDYDNYKMSIAGAKQDQPKVVTPPSRPAVEKPVDDPPVVKSPTRVPASDAAPIPTTAYTRAPVPCVLTNAGDSGHTQAGVAVKKQLLFTHTDEELRPYFRQKELVTCFAGLIRVEDRLYLNLDFQIASSDARKNFGVLETNSMLRLKLIDGSFVNLFNTRADPGKIDAYTGNTLYTGSYLIDNQVERILSTHELDKLRVVWSSGFEDYDVVNLDFLINQFSCIRSDEILK